jgi:hypothetical protein
MRVLTTSLAVALLLVLAVVSIAAAGGSDPLGHRWI